MPEKPVFDACATVMETVLDMLFPLVWCLHGDVLDHARF
jgi:hypothetical protein